MPRNPITGVFDRVSNSFSDPIVNTVIDPNDAIALFDDYDDGLTFNNAEPLILVGSTSGVTNVVASPVASGTLTLPAATDTLVGKATIDTLTNKTFDTAGLGNSLSIAGVPVTANTGTGAVARANGPTFIAPILGAATATTINGNTLTAGNWTLTGGAGKTLTFNNTMVLAGTDGQTYTFPPVTGAVLTAGSTNTLTGKTFDTAGAGNSFSINGVAVTANTGTGAVVRATSATLATPTINSGALSGTFSGAPAFSGANFITNANLVQSAAVTLKGNPTAALANASDFTIQGLPARGAPDAANDRMMLWDAAAGTFKYVTPAQVAAAATSGVSSIAGNTGAFTLSNGITNSVNDIRLDPATQVDMEAGSITNKAVTPGRQQYHPAHPKFWVGFNGTGTPTALASFNLSSITDNGTGLWTLNYTTAFSSANNGVVVGGVQADQIGSANYGSTGGDINRVFSGISAGACTVGAGVDGTTTRADVTYMGVAAYGDQT